MYLVIAFIFFLLIYYGPENQIARPVELYMKFKR